MKITEAYQCPFQKDGRCGFSGDACPQTRYVKRAEPLPERKTLLPHPADMGPTLQEIIHPIGPELLAQWKRDRHAFRIAHEMVGGQPPDSCRLRRETLCYGTESVTADWPEREYFRPPEYPKEKA